MGCETGYQATGIQAGFIGCAGSTALPSDPTARKCVQHVAAAAPLRIRVLLHIQFTTLLKDSISFLLTRLQNVLSACKTSGGERQRSPASLFHLQKEWRERRDLAGAGVGTVDKKRQYGCPGRDKGHCSQLCPERTWGAGRDGAAAVHNANKEVAIYHLTCCGVMKHKLLLSPVFSAPGRGNGILHVKAATHDTFQRKRLYVPKSWRSADQYAAWYDKLTRTIPSAGNGSW